MSKRNCKICGREYSYCPTCGEDRSKPRWYNNYDCENCKEIWTVLVRHGSGELDKAKAAKLLRDLDLTDYDLYTEGVKEHIDELLDKVEPEAVVEPETKVEPEEIKEEIIEEPAEVEDAKEEFVYEVVDSPMADRHENGFKSFKKKNKGY